MMEPQPAFQPIGGNTLAMPLQDGAVHVIVSGANSRWSFVADVPESGRQLIGPPPAYLAVAGWSA